MKLTNNNIEANIGIKRKKKDWVFNGRSTNVIDQMKSKRKWLKISFVFPKICCNFAGI